MVSVLEGCSEGCGIAAALLAVVTWGTFGVPIKCNVDVEVNFFVMQSYKTIVCFVTSWFVVLLGEPIRWTPWGIVSGLFWVPGASCGIYAIRNAGVAVAVGTWSSIQVITSCIFGILIFQESVKSTRQTTWAITTLMIGLVGMSRYSDSSASSSSSTSPGRGKEETRSSSTDIASGTPDYSPVTATDSGDEDDASGTSTPRKTKRSVIDEDTFTKLIPLELEMAQADDIVQPLVNNSSNLDHFYDQKDGKERMVRLFQGRIVLTQRQMGLLAAIINGAWGGLNLIPLHFAKRDSGMSGASYLISYATGSLIVCAAIWAGLFVYHFIHNQYNIQQALDHLPAWHIKELGLPGMLAGLLYSMGNFCSILAVEYLGQGVGFSFCQGQLLVSGLWGVFYFKEIQGRETIINWFASAILTVIGIIWLSSQHEAAPSTLISE